MLMERYSKVIRVTEQFLQDLWAGVYDPAKPLPPEETLAARYGITRISFRRVVANLENIRVLKRIPNKHTIILPDLLLPGSKINSDKTPVAVVFDCSPDSGSMELAKGIREKAAQCNAETVLFQDMNDGMNALAALEKYGIDKFSGVILLPTHNAFVDKLCSFLPSAMPQVALTIRPPQLDIPCVYTDDFDIQHQLVLTLIKRYRRPVYFVTETRAWYPPRGNFGGYCCAMCEAGFGMDISTHTLRIDWPEQTTYSRNEDLEKMLSPLLHKLFKEHPEPLTITAENDYLGREIIDVARQYKRKIGEDLILCGGANLPFSSDKAYSFSSIEQPQKEMGAAALELLLRRIKDPEAAVFDVVFRSRIIERHSTNSEI